MSQHAPSHDAAPQDDPAPNPRSAEILESARLAFAEKGFDGASMQDIARKAGMSVGNFYRYFPSKAAIVDALIQRDLDGVERDFAAILEDPDPITALRAVLVQRVRDDSCAEDGQLWAEITAAALRKPEIGETCLRMERTVVNCLITIFALASNLSEDEARARWSAHAQLLILLIKGCGMRSPDAAASAGLDGLLLRTIDRTLDEISMTCPQKGRV